MLPKLNQKGALFVLTVRLEAAPLRCSDGKAFTLEYDLDTFPGRGGRILNFVKNRSFVVREGDPIGKSQRDVEYAVVI